MMRSHTFQTSVSIRIPSRTCSNKDYWTPFNILRVWDEVWESALLTGSQVLLILLVQGPPIKNYQVRGQKRGGRKYMAKYNGSLSEYPHSRHGKYKNGKHEEFQDKLLGQRVLCPSTYKRVKENLIKRHGTWVLFRCPIYKWTQKMWPVWKR